MIYPAVGSAVVAFGTVIGLAAWVRRRLLVVTVEGPSMEPTLWHGDRVLVRRIRLPAVRTGQLVVVRRPDPISSGDEPPRWLIKRAAAIPGEPVPANVLATVGKTDDLVPAGHLVVLGDNPARSADSRHWGYITADGLLGVVTRQMSKRRTARRTETVS